MRKARKTGLVMLVEISVLARGKGSSADVRSELDLVVPE
jgi:hypothetical protein